jgi:hypothetical protein
MFMEKKPIAMFSKRDIAQMEAKGMLPEAVMLQINRFEKGFPAIVLDRHADAGDGVIRLDDEHAETSGWRF